MPRPPVAPDDDVDTLVRDLQTLRKGHGLTRAKVARARVLCELPVVQGEAQRLGRPAEQIAYHLLKAAVYGLNQPTMRDDLIDAFVLDHTPPGKNLSDRRSRRGADESQVRLREDLAVEEVARWLREMTNPEVLFGDYLSEAASPVPPEWNIGVLSKPVVVDEIHPREEVVWDHLEKTTHLNEHGFAIATETRGTIRAMVDGVTGYTIHYTSNTGSWPTGIAIYKGGKPGRKHPLGPLRTCRLNIDFNSPLQLNHTLQLHWYLDLEPKTDARPVHGMGEAVEIPTRNLTLRAQFNDQCLPIAPRYYTGTPDSLPEPIGPKRPLRLLPGGFISHTWPIVELNRVYVIAWDLMLHQAPQA